MGGVATARRARSARRRRRPALAGGRPRAAPPRRGGVADELIVDGGAPPCELREALAEARREQVDEPGAGEGGDEPGADVEVEVAAHFAAAARGLQLAAEVGDAPLARLGLERARRRVAAVLVDPRAERGGPRIGAEGGEAGEEQRLQPLKEGALEPRGARLLARAELVEDEVAVEIRLVVEVLVERALGDLRAGGDPVEGGLRVGVRGELADRRVDQPPPLGLGQVVEGGLRHAGEI
jgi:hypothetical protein